MEAMLIGFLILTIIIFIRKIIIDKIGKQKYQVIFFNLFTIIMIIFFILNPEIPLSLFNENWYVIIGVLIIIAFILFLDILGIVFWIRGKLND